MKKIIFSVLVLVLSFFVFPMPAFAKVVMQEKGRITVSSTETIDDDLFIGAESADLSGTVTGSVFAGLGSGEIKGNIKGDLLIGGGNINLIGANIDGNVIIGAGNLTIDSTSKIGGSLIVGAGSVSNSAPIGRNTMIGAGSIYLDSLVNKEARLAGGSIELGPHAVIKDNLVYALGENDSTLTQAQTATIGGTVSRFTPPSDARQSMNRAKEDFVRMGGFAKKSWLVISFLGSLLIGFIILKLFPRTSDAVSEKLSKSVWPSIGIGFLVVIAAIPVIFVLGLTIIGLPLAGMLILLFGLGIVLAKLVASYALGKFIVRQYRWKKIGIYGIYTIGLAVFFILRAFPMIGWMVSGAATWVGLGAIWLYARAHLKQL